MVSTVVHTILCLYVVSVRQIERMYITLSCKNSLHVFLMYLSFCDYKETFFLHGIRVIGLRGVHKCLNDPCCCLWEEYVCVCV
jgi:hypothetical protein